MLLAYNAKYTKRLNTYKIVIIFQSEFISTICLWRLVYFSCLWLLC